MAGTLENVDDLNFELAKKWKNEIIRQYDLVKRFPGFGRCFSIDNIKSPIDRVKIIQWSAHPRLLQTCLGPEMQEYSVTTYQRKAHIRWNTVNIA